MSTLKKMEKAKKILHFYVEAYELDPQPRNYNNLQGAINSYQKEWIIEIDKNLMSKGNR